MFRILNNQIILTKGDTARFSIDINTLLDTKYNPTENEIMTFKLKKFLTDADPILKIEYDFENDEFVIKSEDTIDLESGEYFYDVQIVLENGDINTIIPVNTFVIGDSI